MHFSHIILAILAIFAFIGWASSDSEFISDEEAWEYNSLNKMSSAYEE